MPPETNGWNEYSRLVLNEIKRLDKSIREILDAVQELKIEMAVLKVKYALIGGIVGAVAGSVPGVIALIRMFT